MRKKCVGGAGKTAAQVRCHRLDHVFLPQKTVTAPRAEIRDRQSGHAAHALDLLPQLRLRLGIQNVEVEFAELLEIRARAQFVDDGQRVKLPHRRVGPEAVK